MKKIPFNYLQSNRRVFEFKSQLFARAFAMTVGVIVGLVLALIGAFIHYSFFDRPLSLSLGIVGATIFWLTAAFAGAIIGWRRGILRPQTRIGSVPSAPLKNIGSQGSRDFEE